MLVGYLMLKWSYIGEILVSNGEKTDEPILKCSGYTTFFKSSLKI